jgi:hypothetical protein
MNVIRMVKLFGWESKMTQRVADKREEELAWIWKLGVLGIANQVIKFVAFSSSLATLLIVESSYIIPISVMIATYSTYVSAFLSPDWSILSVPRL